MRRFVFVLSLLALSASPASAFAQACIATAPSGWAPTAAGTPGSVPGCVDLLNVGVGPAGFGTGVVPRNDDGFTGHIDLTGAFPGGVNFYGGPYTEMWVNTNGNITFHHGLMTYTPRAFPRPAAAIPANLAPMIAPYWADVDTRIDSLTTGTAPETNHDLVYYDVRPGQITVTWFDVGYFAENYQYRMSFQLILRNPVGTCGSHDFDVEFRYNTCGWVAGTASGDVDGDGHCSSTETTCIPANVGFDAHDGTNFVTIPEALTPAVENVCTMSNVGMPGVYQFQVRSGGLVCDGGGTPCTVAGATGACAAGINVCHAAGVQCQSLLPASAEVCDGVDNDCDGVVDGDNLCGTAAVCVRGFCVQGCLDGGCAPGFACDSGQCVETACVGVTCAEGQRCIGGTCGDACTGIVCPHGQTCTSGRCIDPCAMITCGDGAYCENGVCIDRCPCHACDAGFLCAADGTCIPEACELTVCGAGQYCVDGTCVDECTGVVCPSSQHCELGACIDNGTGTADAGLPVEPDAAIVFPDAALPMIDAGPAGPDSGRVMIPDGGRAPRATESSGCGCRAARGGSAGPIWLLGLAALVAARRRRRS